MRLWLKSRIRVSVCDGAGVVQRWFILIDYAYAPQGMYTSYPCQQDLPNQLYEGSTRESEILRSSGSSEL